MSGLGKIRGAINSGVRAMRTANRAMRSPQGRRVLRNAGKLMNDTRRKHAAVTAPQKYERSKEVLVGNILPRIHVVQYGSADKIRSKLDKQWLEKVDSSGRGQIDSFAEELDATLLGSKDEDFLNHLYSNENFGTGSHH